MRGTATEDYIKAVYKLQRLSANVSTSALADKMGTSAAAVTKMLKHLAALQWADYTPYHGVRLTDTGEKVALEVIRHHRLLELYLAQAMGYAWDEVDAEAEKLEHVISEEFEARMDALLGYPTACPHGDPIPTREGGLRETLLRTLAECAAGETVTISRVKDTDPQVLRTLAARAMLLQASVSVVERDAVDGLLTIDVGGQRHVVGPALAGSVFVTPQG